jgi:hypothetical protein
MTSSDKIFRPPWLRGLGVGLGVVGLILFKLSTWARADSPEEQSYAAHLAFYRTAPLAASALCLTFWVVYKWRLSWRLPFAIAMSGIIWLVAWQLLVYLVGHAHG